ncbi:MAG: molybdenum cofactor guanylyltransferase [Beutenbergiaceae bacterium]
MSTAPTHLDAVILTGGRGERLGGATKATLLIGGEELVVRALRSARSIGARRCVVVGEASACVDAPVVREEPIFGGPAAGLAAGLQHLAAAPVGDWVLTLAVDLVDHDAVTATLQAALPVPPEHDGVILRAPDGYRQWLAAIYSHAYLSQAIAALDTPSGTSMHRLLAQARLLEVDAPEPVTADIDTWDDLVRYTDGEEGHERPTSDPALD